MTDPDFARLATEWLRSLAPNANIAWGHDLARYLEHSHTGWIDVIVPAACDHTGTNWLVCILADDDDDAATADGIENLAVTQDHWICGRVEHYSFVDGTVTVTDASTPERDERDDGTWIRRGAWHTDTLNAALAAWAERLSGRTDLTFSFDDTISSSMAAEVADIVDALARGDEDTYDIGDGVHISSTAMDTLLALEPDTAAELTDVLKDAVGARRS